MKNKLRVIAACVAAIALGASGKAFAIPKKSPSPAPSPNASPATKSTAPTDATKVRAIPFRGKIAAVDQKAKTFTIAGKEKSRVFKITNRTMLTKAGTAATMKDLVVNEEVRGSYWKITDGSFEAKTVKLGPMTDAEKAAAEKQAKKKTPKAEASPDASAAAPASPSPSAPPTP
jgi:hypothetical protein